MFTFRRPTDEFVKAFLAKQKGEPWSYDCPGITRGEADPNPSPGWKVDHQRVKLGHGSEDFQAAKQAIQGWRMFPPEMAALFWADTPLVPGHVVAVRFWAAPLALWMLFPCRVVYAIDEPRRFGFAYGTLPDHAERGEERFLVEWDVDDTVWYDLLAVSRPAHWLARIGYPYTRWQQARFRRLSGLAMQAAMCEANS